MIKNIHNPHNCGYPELHIHKDRRREAASLRAAKTRKKNRYNDILREHGTVTYSQNGVQEMSLTEEGQRLINELMSP